MQTGRDVFQDLCLAVSRHPDTESHLGADLGYLCLHPDRLPANRLCRRPRRYRLPLAFVAAGNIDLDFPAEGPNPFS